MLFEPPGASKEHLFGLLTAWKDPADTHQAEVAAAMDAWSSSPTFLPDCLSLVMDPAFSGFFRHIHLLIARHPDLSRVAPELVDDCRQGAALLADLIRTAQSDVDVSVYAASYQRVLFEVGFETLDALIAVAFEQLASDNPPDVHRAICILANVNGLLSTTANPTVLGMFEAVRFYENFVEILSPYFEYAVGNEDFDRCSDTVLTALGRGGPLFNRAFFDVSLESDCFFLAHATRILAQLAGLEEWPSYASDLAETCMLFVTRLFRKIILPQDAAAVLERIPDFPSAGLRVVARFPFDHPTTRFLLEFFRLEAELLFDALPFDLDDAVRFLVRSTAMMAGDVNLAGENPFDFWSLAYGREVDTSAARGDAICLLQRLLGKHTDAVMECAVQVFREATDDPESLVRIAIEIVRAQGPSAELFDVFRPLCEPVHGDGVPERICFRDRPSSDGRGFRSR